MVKMKWKKPNKTFISAALCCMLAAGLTIFAAVYFKKEAAESSLVSAGLQHIADDALVAASAPAGETITFSAAWLDETLAGGTVSAITVTALPAATEGRLMLGHGEVKTGQVIPRETLSYLTFSPNEGVKKSSFCFMPSTLDGESGYVYTCHLALTDGVNCCPTGAKTVTAVFTYSDLALCGTLVAYDPEGGALRYEILDYPQSGTVFLNDVSGEFVYHPVGNFAGEDGFTWRAQDAAGAFSSPVSVKVTVRTATGKHFSDVTDTNTQAAALRASESALMSGETVGGKEYFRPNEGVTRAAFVATLLRAAEINTPEANDTGFEDDADIPVGMKGAVRYAKKAGWLGNDARFRPNDLVTRAEAARIAAAVLKLGTPEYAETVRDFAEIPIDVADALYAIYEGGYLATLADGTLSPGGALSRGDAARFFTRILDGKHA